MSDIGNFGLTVGADVEGLTSGLDKGVSKMQTFGVAVDKLVATTGKTEAGFKKVSTGANQAGTALQNLGRVAQDAPFGFIGIQNNLSPLLESFQRLRAEAGSNVGALKALGSSLVGAGGIGLALSAVTAAVSISQLGFSAWTRGFGESEKAVENLGNKIQSLTVDFDEAKRSSDAFTKSIDALKGLRDVNLKLNLPNEKQRLNVEFGFDKADAEEKLRQLQALEKTAEESRARALNLLLSEGSTALKDLVGTYTLLNDVKKNGTKLTDNDNQLLDAAIKAEQEKVKVINEQAIARIGISRLEAQNKEDIIELNKKEAERLKNLNTIGKVLERLARQIGLLNEQELKLGTDESRSKISAIESAIQQLVRDFKVSPKDTIIQKLLGDINALSTFKPIKFKPEDLSKLFFDDTSVKLTVPAFVELEFKKSLVQQDPLGGLSGIINANDFTAINAIAELQGYGITKAIQDGINTGVAGLRFPNLKKLLEETKERFDDLKNNLSEVAKSTVVNALAGLGESLGRAFSDGVQLKDIFGSIFQVIGAGLRSMGEAMITYGTGIIILKKAIKNPYLAIAAGVGLIALGTVLEAAIPKFATGTQNFRGGLALVGERGPELLNLPKQSGITSNDKLANITGGGAQVVVLETVVRGQDLFFVQRKVESSNNRRF